MQRILVSFCILLLIGTCARPRNTESDTWDVRARSSMVRNQIVARGITDTLVIKAMTEIPRHEFVPREYQHMAYGDFPLPIGEGQTISQPYIVALMTEEIELVSSDRVLEIGTGSGYQAAVLAIICEEVYSIEIVPSLAENAGTLLKELGYNNVHVKCGDGFLGWPEAAPFDAIIITCAPKTVPEPLIEQLTEGGRLIVPLGDDFQMLTLFIKTEGELQRDELIPVRFVPMKGKIEEYE
ncbi:MAG: protein-L-isoaspartate(D-aspartate) O-methyltransferase [candidate division WOR-3 bacterium]|nr:MAG: protein-L-isoaspartate(D-aspartate) O-methyltransferase [candidate division WOR-3 bacterium]